jgi:hypothetical protein
MASDPPSNEFRIEGAGSESPDAALHEEMLANEEAAAVADIMAVKAAIAAGIPAETAVRLMAGDLARSRLIASGILDK